MPCFRPLNGFRSKIPNPATGKRSIVFNRQEADLSLDPVVLPCGQCRYCRLENSRQWAVRCVHEASLFERNCFLTLTYRDDALPPNGSLNYEHPVLFMKRLRERHGSGIRSFGCAEYGEQLGRPHYHLCIFNFDFSDKVLFKRNGDNSLFTSKDLESLWPHGHSTVGGLTFESAAYVARYVVKKRKGKNADYDRLVPSTGELVPILPERSICVSRRPGIGREWYMKFGKYVRDHDSVVVRGIKMRPAKYYDRLFDLADPVAFAKVKEARKVNGDLASEVLASEDSANFKRYFDKSSDGPMPLSRLSVLEEVQELKFNLLKRGYENG